MAYFFIGNTDFSDKVASLTVATKQNYNAQTNAAGDTVVDNISAKRTVTITTIPMTQAELQTLLLASTFSCMISFLNPETGELTESIPVIVPQKSISFYTIQNNKVVMKAVQLSYQEL